jgi:hypothetical protein
MDTSLGALRARLFSFRSWDSTGTTLDKRVRDAMNTALARISGDVPEAVVPDDEHIVLYQDVVGSDAAIGARLEPTVDPRVFKFVTPTGAVLTTGASWLPDTTGIHDGIMHFEIPDASGQVHRRQSREFWSGDTGGTLTYYVSIDRPWDIVAPPGTIYDFRMHQPEFFVSDDVTRVLEPARIFDETRQQIWAIDTGGAYRQDMVDFRGDDKGRPFRLWRGRHFQLPAPTTAPTITSDDKDPWLGPEWEGEFTFVYTYVWGRKDAEWQSAPGGVRDPQWESAPSPVSAVFNHSTAPAEGIYISATNIDAMMDFGTTGTLRYSRSGLRIRIYVARTAVRTATPYGAGFDRVETNGKYYLLDEFEPTSSSYLWRGAVIPDYQRPLKHSTGYYSYGVFPHQDQRYELDVRVQRLPRSLYNDQDTVPIQQDAVQAYLELSLHYMCLMDGVDQTGANQHIMRYNELCRHFRKRYANPGGVVEPLGITGYQVRYRYGRYRDTT